MVDESYKLDRILESSKVSKNVKEDIRKALTMWEDGDDIYVDIIDTRKKGFLKISICGEESGDCETQIRFK